MSDDSRLATWRLVLHCSLSSVVIRKSSSIRSQIELIWDLPRDAMRVVGRMWSETHQRH